MLAASAPVAPDLSCEMVELLAFLVSNEEFGLPVMQVREIRTWSAPTPLPHSDPALAGVINLRGTVLAVIDLARSLALAPARGDTPPVIVVIEDRGGLTGLIVDRVLDIIALPAASLEPAPVLPSGNSASSLAALAMFNGRFLRILNPTALLSDRPGDLA